MSRLFLPAVAACLITAASASAATPIRPSASYLYAQREDGPLWLDIYDPAPCEVQMPTVIFIFGGGFVSGTRDAGHFKPFYRQLSEAGYRVVAIDYRLGLKGVTGMGISQRDKLKKAIDMAVEDLCSAVRFLLDNSDVTGVKSDAVVLCGSSAGAITALQADWERCNGGATASALPEGFAFAGVAAFSGAIYSESGVPAYRKSSPAPTVFFHGIDDKIVTYTQIRFMSLCFGGSSCLCKVFEKNDWPYAIYRFKGIGHEVAGSMVRNFPLMDRFIRLNVMGGGNFVEDSTISDSAIKPREDLKSLDQLYGK